jgi:taurine--2-oxoglutarate transaminase
MSISPAAVQQAADAFHMEKEYLLQPWMAQNNYKPFVISRAEGCYFWDDKGKRYLDFQSQLVNVNAGHQHPRIIQAIKDQADRLCYVVPGVVNDQRALLAKMIAERAPGDLSKSFLVTGGGIANENALKIARAVTGRQKVIARFRSYHGATYGAGSVMGDPRRRGVEPGVPGSIRVWDAFCYRCFFRMEHPSCGLYCAKALREVIEVEGPDTVAAIIVEPITASNCRLVPPGGYMEELRKLCDEYGILLIFDEVMTGFGRTGKWFAAEHWGVTPDIMTLSKGINNGCLPLGAVVMTPKVAAHFDTNMLFAGLTQYGNPIACASAIATMRVYEDEGMIENAATLGPYLMTLLEQLKERHPSVGDVRGMGLFAAIDLVKDRGSREPLVPWTTEWAEKKDPVVAGVLARLKELGVSTYSRWSVIMICPPLCITRGELTEGIEQFDDALKIADAAVAAKG